VDHLLLKNKPRAQQVFLDPTGKLLSCNWEQQRAALRSPGAWHQEQSPGCSPTTTPLVLDMAAMASDTGSTRGGKLYLPGKLFKIRCLLLVHAAQLWPSLQKVPMRHEW
jgi:hypothetical protein